MFYKNFISSISKLNKITGLYIFSGISSKNKLECIRNIEKLFSSSFDTTFFSLDEKKITSSEVINHIDTFPLFVKYKIIVIKLSSTGHNDFLKELGNHYDKLKFPDYSLIILDIDKVPKTKTFEKYFTKKANNIIEFELKKEFEIKKWINNFFNENSRKIDNDTVNLLYERFGNNLEVLSSEINKIINSNNSKIIKYDDIISIISLGNTPEFFSIIDDVLHRKKSCLEKLHQKIFYDEQLYEIFSYCRKCIRYLLQSLVLLNENSKLYPNLKRTLFMGLKNKSDYRLSNQIRSELNILKKNSINFFSEKSDSNVLKTHPFQMQKFFCASILFNIEELKEIEKNSILLDRAHKSGNIDLKTALLQLITSVVIKKEK